MAYEINATLNREELEALAVCPEQCTCYQCLLEEDCKKCNTRVWSNTAKTALTLYDMLEQLEWIDGEWCPICDGRFEHKLDCELAALLKESEVEHDA